MPFKIPTFLTTKLIYLFALFVFLAILSLTLFNIKTSETPSQSPSPVAKTSQPPKTKKETKNPKVEALIKSAQSLPGKYGIFIKDLKTQNAYELNTNQVFGAASVYKLAVMYAAYDAIESGKLKKSDVLSAAKTTLDQEIASKQNPVIDPEAQTRRASPTQTTNQSETVSYSVQEALMLMITISDNYSAILLSEKLGWVNMDKFMEAEGFSEINLAGINSPNLTARSAGALLGKIYNKEAVSKKFSEEMINLLLAQKINDRIPKYLPVDTKVAHKTGELETIRNDVGIIYGKKADYIFVFLSDTKNPLDASEQIALLSEKIYQELEQ